MLKPESDTKRKKRNNEFSITCGILPPGTLKRKGRRGESSQEKWDDIVEICAEVIVEESQD